MTEPEAQDAMRAVLEALDIPHGATMGDQQERDQILVERAGHAVVMLRGILGGDSNDPAWSVGYLREQLAKHPAAGYWTWEQRMARPGASR